MKIPYFNIIAKAERTGLEPANPVRGPGVPGQCLSQFGAPLQNIEYFIID